MKGSLYCPSCTKSFDEDVILSALHGSKIKALTDILESKELYYLLQNEDTLDNILMRIYTLDRAFFKQYIDSIPMNDLGNLLLLRIKTHSNTYLCGIVAFMLRTDSYPDAVEPSCINCLKHLVRYGTEENKSSIQYSIDSGLAGPHHINMRGILTKNTNITNSTNSTNSLHHLINLGDAIIERDGVNNLFASYNTLVESVLRSQPLYDSYISEIIFHPLLHKSILDSNDRLLKKRLYQLFRQRKSPFWEELMAKAMHPSRVIYWCMAEDEKGDFVDIPDYEFLRGGARWNIVW